MLIEMIIVFIMSPWDTIITGIYSYLPMCIMYIYIRMHMYSYIL